MMNDELNGREQRIAELLDYLDSWQSAQLAYWAWIDREYNRRLMAFTALRKTERRKLGKAIRLLKFDKHGRVTKDRAAQRRFKAARDRILVGVVARAKRIFGYVGKPNAAGIFIGAYSPELRAKVAAALRKATSGDQ